MSSSNCNILSGAHKIGVFVFFVLLLPFVSRSQELKINHLEYKEGQIIVSYDLHDSLPGRAYTVRVYSSVDNFINPLSQIAGDHGIDVTPGPDKKIVWDVARELGDEFNGKFSLELKARVYIPFVRMEGFEKYAHVKRGSTHNLTWTGGTAQNILNFELMRGEHKVASFPNIANVGHYKMSLPKNIKPGNDYRFKISDSKNKDEVVYTSTFKVRRKVPLVVKAVSMLAGAGIAAYLLQDFSIVDPPLPN